MNETKTAIPGVVEKNSVQNALLKMEIGLLKFWVPSLIAFGVLLFALLGFSVIVFRFMMNPIKEDVAKLEAGQKEIRMDIKEIRIDITELRTGQEELKALIIKHNK